MEKQDAKEKHLNQSQQHLDTQQNEPLITKHELSLILYELLFKDNNGVPYSNECSQNKIVRNIAEKYKLQLTNTKNQPNGQ